MQTYSVHEVRGGNGSLWQAHSHPQAMFVRRVNDFPKRVVRVRYQIATSCIRIVCKAAAFRFLGLSTGA